MKRRRTTRKEYVSVDFAQTKVGYKEEQSNKWGECWWFNAYDSAVKKIGSSSTDTDSESESSTSVSTPKVYTGESFC